MTYDPDTVATTYDVLSVGWTEWATAVSPPVTPRYLAELMTHLPEGGRVLELGCGSGIPVAARLVTTGFEYQGVDLSPGMVDEARRNVPGGRFRVADMADVEMPPAATDAVVAFYSIFHLPRERHAGLFRSVRSWLRPGGWFVFSQGAADGPGGTEHWLDAGEMFWSNFDPEETQRLLRAAGLHIVSTEIHDQVEPGGEPVRFLFVVARR